MALEQGTPDEAYQLGRLFAVLEFAQKTPSADVNRTVKDAYFGSAAATPAIVFPRLMRLHHHHVEKLPTKPEAGEADKKRTKGFFERLVQEICGHISHFPPHLPPRTAGALLHRVFPPTAGLLHEEDRRRPGDDR